ncbi:MAG: hypothetical protein HFG22_03490 [Lachnospiraceae bacterium]|nr:hypothetical protein [Lachnospiraceae bacterium]
MSLEEKFMRNLKELLSITAEINMETDLLDIDEWDSFSAMSFLSMIESEYGIKAEPFSIAEAVIVEDLFNITQIK